ncbi:CLOCK-interacting pacemaker a [Thalassophryne amazonica]|uniref:CLOCK-interacting pacemaker a n=1 Tax=Thalassophryne amazonica TaxID=390379 RepID=UPI0014725A24|nr:CLOCK-interacting pacemaker a [Thalassophryne amazonica]
MTIRLSGQTSMSSFLRPGGHRIPPFTMATHLGTSRSDLERDSGFSDEVSEYLSAVDLTDFEDAGQTGSIVSQDHNVTPLAVMRGSYAGLSPTIIMNNLVMKQPSVMASAENQWGFPSPLDVMPPSQVVLLQPMLSNTKSSSLAGSENYNPSRISVPILKTYPRIAPHPGERAAKRLGSSRVRGSSMSGYDQRQRRHHHGHRPYSPPSPQPEVQTEAKPVPCFEAANHQTQTADRQDLSTATGSGSLFPFTYDLSTVTNTSHADKYQEAFSVDNDNKLKRFSNTYNILNKCGLLGIALRTKQLIKENRHTQTLLQQLRDQTSLLLEALRSGDPQLWTQLQISLQDTDRDHRGTQAQIVMA